MNIVDFKGEERFRFLMGDKQIYWSWVGNKFVTPVMSSKSPFAYVVDKHELNDMYTTNPTYQTPKWGYPKLVLVAITYEVDHSELL